MPTRRATLTTTLRDALQEQHERYRGIAEQLQRVGDPTAIKDHDAFAAALEAGATVLLPSWQIVAATPGAVPEDFPSDFYAVDGDGRIHAR